MIQRELIVDACGKCIAAISSRRWRHVGDCLRVVVLLLEFGCIYFVVLVASSLKVSATVMLRFAMSADGGRVAQGGDGD